MRTKKHQEEYLKIKIDRRMCVDCILVNTCAYVFRYIVIIHESTVSILILMTESNNCIECFISKIGIICDIKRTEVYGNFYFINVYQLILSLRLFSSCIQDKDQLIWQFSECFYKYYCLVNTSTAVSGIKKLSILCWSMYMYTI